jgi:hypothetical protein
LALIHRALRQTPISKIHVLDFCAPSIKEQAMKSRKSRKSSSKHSIKKRKAKSSKTLTKGSANGRRLKRTPADPNNPLEKALTLIKQGVSQAGAAKIQGVTEQRLARYRKATTTSKRKDRKWVIIDRRPAEMYIAENGKLSIIAVPNHAKSTIGRYWNGVNKFLTDNDPAHLQPYVGHSVRDSNRKKHFFETGPNTLRMLDSMGELSFVTVYANTAR